MPPPIPAPAAPPVRKPIAAVVQNNTGHNQSPLSQGDGRTRLARPDEGSSPSGSTPSDSKPQELEIVVAQSGLGLESSQPIVVAFQPFMAQIEEWRKKCAGINVTSADQKHEIEMAGIGRSFFKKLRCNAENTRKRLKEDIVKRGRFIDSVAGVITGAIEPLEQHLKEQEEFVERQEQARKAVLKSEREEALRKYGADTTCFLLADMSEDNFRKLLADAKIAYDAKVEAAAKAEAYRLAKIEADRVERERLRVENERLWKEQADAEAARKETDRLAAIERDRLAAIAKTDREAREKAERETKRVTDETVTLQATITQERQGRQSAEAEVRAMPARIEAAVRSVLPTAKRAEVAAVVKATVQAPASQAVTPAGKFIIAEKGEDYHWAMKLQSFEPSPNYGNLSAEDAEHNAAVNYFRKKSGAPLIAI